MTRLVCLYKSFLVLYHMENDFEIANMFCKNLNK